MPEELIQKEIEILSKKELDRTTKYWLFKSWKRFQIWDLYCLLEYQLEEFVCLNS